jgi:hypothetical protein
MRSHGAPLDIKVSRPSRLRGHNGRQSFLRFRMELAGSDLASRTNQLKRDPLSP